MTNSMDTLVSSLFLLSTLPLALCQYEHGRGFQSVNQPPASIILHKQALGQDGSFNYAFAADNGLQQGEIINPDGSRKGSYSYVDPNGKTITLSYTAGKDGFRVLNGDHVPKAPEQQQQQQKSNPGYYQQPRPNTQYPQQEQPHYPAPFQSNAIPYEAYKNSPNAPAYRGNPVPYEEAYRSAPHAPAASPHGAVAYRASPVQYEAAYRHAPQPQHARPMQHYQPRQYSVQEGNYDRPSHYVPQPYQDSYRQEPQKPHSFGEGFAFEFAG